MKIEKLKGGFFQTDNRILDLYLNMYEKIIFITLCRFANNETRKCYPSIKVLKEKTSIKSRTTIIKYIKTLEEKKLIIINKHKNKSGYDNNEYFICSLDGHTTKKDDVDINSYVQEMDIVCSPDGHTYVQEMDTIKTQGIKTQRKNTHISNSTASVVSDDTEATTKVKSKYINIYDYKTSNPYYCASKLNILDKYINLERVKADTMHYKIKAIKEKEYLIDDLLEEYKNNYGDLTIEYFIDNIEAIIKKLDVPF